MVDRNSPTNQLQRLDHLARGERLAVCEMVNLSFTIYEAQKKRRNCLSKIGLKFPPLNLSSVLKVWDSNLAFHTKKRKNFLHRSFLVRTSLREDCLQVTEIEAKVYWQQTKNFFERNQVLEVFWKFSSWKHTAKSPKISNSFPTIANDYNYSTPKSGSWVMAVGLEHHGNNRNELQRVRCNCWDSLLELWRSRGDSSDSTQSSVSTRFQMFASPLKPLKRIPRTKRFRGQLSEICFDGANGSTNDSIRTFLIESGIESVSRRRPMSTEFLWQNIDFIKKFNINKFEIKKFQV